MHLKFFPSFFDKPKNISFANQEPDEKIELFLRQHWIVNLPWIFLSLTLILIPPVLIALDRSFNLNISLQIPTNILLGGLILWYMLTFAYVLESFLHWYFNIYIVTTRNIVDINFYSLGHRDITEARLDDIQTVNSQVKGVLQSLFYFGDVLIHTAAERTPLTFADVPKPDIVTDRIQDLQHIQETIH